MSESDSSASGRAQPRHRGLRPASLLAKVKRAGAVLRDEFEAGKRGDGAEPEQLWPSANEQLAAMMSLLTGARRAGPSSEPVESDVDSDAAEVAAALGGIDWAGVRAATAERTSDAAKAMRTMAGQVDWAKVQPVAGQVSSALIAAVASGQLGVGGRLGPAVARAIVDQGGLGQRVAKQIHQQQSPMPPDFRGVIDTTARDV